MNRITRTTIWVAAPAALVLGGLAGCSNSDEKAEDTTPETTEAVAPDRTIEFDAVDFDYETLDLSGISSGDTIRFVMQNTGAEPHEFEVLGPDGEALGEVEKTAIGETGEATITFEEPGSYTYQCILESEQHNGDSHDSLGMTGTFEVA